MNNFMKEDRYLVMKRSEIESGLDAEQKSILFHLAQKVAAERRSLGKPVLECVVVESDWPNYNEVWESVESVANGSYQDSSQTINHLTEENDKLRISLKQMLKAYCDLVNSGDAGDWDPEGDQVVINARSVL